MEVSKVEMKAVEMAIGEKEAADKRQLDELELALIGGGCGDVQF